jgi:hypothetical protein
VNISRKWLWHRFLPPDVAWAATGSAIALATGFRLDGRYDPSLAVLVATLIAVVWYTYFTFRSTHPLEPVRLRTSLRWVGGPQSGLRLSIHNTSGRDVKARVCLTVMRDQRIRTGPQLDGTDPIYLEPHQELIGWVALDVQKIPGTAALRITWEDDQGGSGETREKVWIIDSLRGAVTGVMPSQNLEAIAKHMVDPPEPDQ